MSSRSFEESLLLCRRALKKAHVYLPPRKAFSTSSTRTKNGSLPKYIETSKPELNQLLANVKARIFVPAHLKKNQQNLIYKTKNHPVLLNEPFYVDIGDESIQLQPIDRTKDVPDSWGSLKRAIELFEDSARDWNNLPALLQGMRTAGRRWKIWQWQDIIRSAGCKGMTGALVEAAKTSERTGLSLDSIQLVRETMWACRAAAFETNWEKEALQKAVKSARQFADLLERRKHRHNDPFDPKRQPDIAGVLLELETKSSQISGASNNEMVILCAQRVVASLHDMHNSLNSGQAGTIEPAPSTNGRKQLTDADYELRRLVPIWHGLSSAQDLLEEEMPQSQLAKEQLRWLHEKITQNLVILRESGSSPALYSGISWATAVGF